MRKLKYFLLPLCGILVFLSGCKSNDRVEITALPCQTESGSSALVKSDGEIIGLDFSDQSVGQLVNGFFTVATPDGVTVCRLTSDGPEVVEGLSGLRSAGYMACGVMPVCRPGRHVELVDGAGETVASLELPDGEVTETAPCFIDGALAVTTDSGLSGLVDTEGNFVVTPRFASIGPVSDGLMVAMADAETDGGTTVQLFSVIDVKGNEVFSFPASMTPVCETFAEGKIPVRCEDGFAVADVRAGGALTQLPRSVRRIEDVGDGLIVYRDSSGRRGLMDFSGKSILDPVYRVLRIGSDGVVAANDGAEWSLIGRDGTLIRTLPGFVVVSPAPRESSAGGFAFVGRNAAGSFLLDKKGEIVNTVPLRTIDYSRLLTRKVTTDYPVRTAPVELPGEENPENEP
ncbi:MAG: WG repeat-containing protein [Paramuribaculum sp.]|nr:WG repeat-containing protein [Paramuribaculum sp.]MDE6489228.1 WG repeat-containing protein [Paramuribaculum sp.]